MGFGLFGALGSSGLGLQGFLVEAPRLEGSALCLEVQGTEYVRSQLR